MEAPPFLDQIESNSHGHAALDSLIEDLQLYACLLPTTEGEWRLILLEEMDEFFVLLRDDLWEHIEEEETSLFTLVTSKLGDQRPVERLVEQHERIKEAVVQVATQLKVMVSAEAVEGSAVTALVEALNTLAGQFKAHDVDESEVLLRALAPAPGPEDRSRMRSALFSQPA